MFSFILYIVVFLALTATAHGSRCLKCLNRNGDTCEGESVSCKGESQCVVTSEYSITGGKVSHSIAKGCAEEILCGSTIDVNNGMIRIRENFKCCSGDNCNTYNYYMPPDNGKPSGKVCPVCFKLNSFEEYISDQKLVCKDKEDKCYSFIGTVRDAGGVETQYTSKGCMSPSLCEFGVNLVVGFEEIESSGIHCT